MNDSILEEALHVVRGSRQNDYGGPSQNMQRTAQIWSAILGIEVEPWQVAACMVGTKLARLVETPHKRDTWVDVAGYADVGYITATNPCPTPENAQPSI